MPSAFAGLLWSLGDCMQSAFVTGDIAIAIRAQEPVLVLQYAVSATQRHARYLVPLKGHL